MLDASMKVDIEAILTHRDSGIINLYLILILNLYEMSRTGTELLTTMVLGHEHHLE